VRRTAKSDSATVLSENLAKAVNDKSRHIKIRGKQAIVPLKFDEDGNPATLDKLIFKRLSLNDLRFLNAWRSAHWDISKAIQDSGISPEKAERLVKKLACFREEDAKVKALCEIPTPDWIKSKHVENIYSRSLKDTQQKSLAELAKIEGAYKQTAPTNQLNVFNITLTPEEEAKYKPVFDAIAETSHVA